MNRKTIGTLGEIDAVALLEARGYRIVDANVRPIGGRSRGEIDIVAWHGECLVFVEVKTRRAIGFVSVTQGASGPTGVMSVTQGASSPTGVVPAEAVDWRKRRQLLKLAYAYLLKHGLDDVPCRFDVVEVIRGDSSTELNVIENAFDGNDI